MRRGLKHTDRAEAEKRFAAARAAPYEKGTETRTKRKGLIAKTRRARGPL